MLRREMGEHWIMSGDFSCELCMKTFKFKSALEFHFDVTHNCVTYMCKICENSKENLQKGLIYTYFELLDHTYKFHDTSIYKILDNLNIY